MFSEKTILSYNKTAHNSNTPYLFMHHENLGDNPHGKQTLTLVEQFEEMLRSNNSIYFSVEELEKIIEYYESYFEFEKALKAIAHSETMYKYISVFKIKKAQFLIELDRYKSALRALDEAEILAPQQIEIALLRSEIYSAGKRYKDALCELKEALDKADKIEKVEIYMRMSDIYDNMSNNQKAYKCLKKALALQPDHETALSRIDYFVEQDRCYAESICLHEKIINRVPYCYLAWYNLGNAYFALRQYDKAIEAYDFVTAINEKYDLAYRNTGHAYLLLGEYGKAKQNFIEASTYDDEPDDELYYYIALCNYHLSNIDDAFFYANKCLDINAVNSQALFLKGKCFAFLGNHIAALDYFDRTHSYDKNNIQCVAAIADIHRQLEDYDMAITFYQYAIVLNPQQLDHYQALSLTYLDAQCPKEALSICFAAMAKANSEIPRFCYLTALALFADNNSQEALDYCAKGLSQDFEDHQILYSEMPVLLLNSRLKDLIALYQP